jgi:hypothetical protein
MLLIIAEIKLEITTSKKHSHIKKQQNLRFAATNIIK